MHKCLLVDNKGNTILESEGYYGRRNSVIIVDDVKYKVYSDEIRIVTETLKDSSGKPTGKVIKSTVHVLVLQEHNR